MDYRIIPAVAMGVVSLLAACSDPLIGDWELKDARPDGLTVPISYGGYDDYCGNYSVAGAAEITGMLEIKDDLDANLTTTVVVEYEFESEYCGSENYDETYTYSYTGDASKEAKGEYDINLNGDDNLQLSCELDGDDLECTVQGGDVGSALIFERK